MSSDQDHGAYVDLDAFESTLDKTRLARLGLDALLRSLPEDLVNTPAENALWEIHDRICEKELADLRLWGVTQQHLIRPINPARPPAPGDMEKITAAIRTLASLGLIAGRGSDRRQAGA